MLKPEHVREKKSAVWKKENLARGFVDPLYRFGTILQMRENVYSIYTKSLDGHGDPWMHLILGPEKALLIDTGFGIGDIRGLVKKLAGGREILVANTHSHLDHCYGNFQFDRVYCHKHAVSALKKHNEKMWDPLLDNRGHGIYQNFDKHDLKKWKEYEIRICAPHTRFILGRGYEVEMIFMPGHSKDHVCFLDHYHRILFGGDALLYVSGIGEDGTDYRQEEYGQYATVEAFHKELEILAERMGEFDEIFMGHMVLGEDKQLVADMLNCTRAILNDPDSNPYIHTDRYTGAVNKVMTSGMAAVEYCDSRIWMDV